MWDYINSPPQAIATRAGTSLQVWWPNKNVVVHHLKNQGAACKRVTSSPGIEGPHQSVGGHHPGFRGHTEAWKSITPS